MQITPSPTSSPSSLTIITVFIAATNNINIKHESWSKTDRGDHDASPLSPPPPTTNNRYLPPPHTPWHVPSSTFDPSSLPRHSKPCPSDRSVDVPCRSTSSSGHCHRCRVSIWTTTWRERIWRNVWGEKGCISATRCGATVPSS
mmetsp:Transcript_11457/g.23498  ORF Transcript_11457/g.23498 Transcript_11457/m.23498 type:complete len:144 (+) Transcript_11457:291-722(+)